MFEAEELERLRAVRRAAREILESTVIRSGGDIGVSISARSGGEVSISRRGHDSERFRSFMIALRRTYAQNDGAHFLTALNVLAKHCEDRRPHLSRLRASYLAVLKSNEVELDGLTHADVFEAWLYGSVFHDDDPNLRQRWEALASSPLLNTVASMLVEATAVQLAHHVLALDDVIAEVLEEDPLPPIEPLRDPTSEMGDDLNAFVSVRVRRHGPRGSRRIEFINTGTAEARNVDLQTLTPLNGGHEGVLVGDERERKFPAPRLRPGESVSLLAAPTMGSPTEFEVVVGWDDPSGQRRVEDFRIDLFSV